MDLIDGDHWLLGGKDGTEPIAVSFNTYLAVLSRGGDYGSKRVAFSQPYAHVEVSTVFTAHNHSFSFWADKARYFAHPLTFETMVFGGRLDQLTRRYETWEDAMAGHRRIVRAVLRAERGTPAPNVRPSAN